MMMQSHSTAEQLGSSLPKRKAVYVTIETLVHSQYNIDLPRLKDELRTLTTQDTDVAASGTLANNLHSNEEMKENKEPTLRSSFSSYSQSSISLAKHHHQSRLQPPRDGFNLCV